MVRISTSTLRRYLSGGSIVHRECLMQHQRSTWTPAAPRLHTATESTHADTAISFRKQLKDEAKKRKHESLESGRSGSTKQSALADWELTVGIEIHARLNTARKLFSSAASTTDDAPNTHVALFDVAMPGSQPTFQKETLIPAIRAALALNCKVQKTSKFDRKHYFHWDQPSGYQITQYYEPLAKDGYITLYAHDGIAKEDGDEIRIGIKQIQMEQDTAKTMSQPILDERNLSQGVEHLLDFNRAGSPLIEIITLPHIHHPKTAAAFVKKVQDLLKSVDACVLGMESGGLRADVNVSIRRKGEEGDVEYGGVKGLGRSNEIKNLSSFKAVEDAILAEQASQIRELEAGGSVGGETRGWTIGATETRTLRKKEGEIDYRYMPDPDLGPVIIGDDLLQHLESTLGVLPEAEVQTLVSDFGLTAKDALSLISLDDGGRVEYFYNVVEHLAKLDGQVDLRTWGKLASNWVLHEMGALVASAAEDDNPLGMNSEGNCIIPSSELASLIRILHEKLITGSSAKKILAMLFANSSKQDSKSAKDLIEEQGLWFTPLSTEEYEVMARNVMNPKIVDEILSGKDGKINFLLGQMMRNNKDGRIDAQEATAVLKRLIDEHRKV